MAEESWLLLAEDDGPDGNGRVLAYMAFDTEQEAIEVSNIPRGELLDYFDLYTQPGEEIPANFAFEVIEYSDHKASYGKHMPLRNFVKNPWKKR